MPRGHTVIGERHAVRIIALARGPQYSDDLRRQVENLLELCLALAQGRGQLFLLCHIDAGPDKSSQSSPERRRSERTESSYQVARRAW